MAPCQQRPSLERCSVHFNDGKSNNFRETCSDSLQRGQQIPNFRKQSISDGYWLVQNTDRRWIRCSLLSIIWNSDVYDSLSNGFLALSNTVENHVFALLKVNYYFSLFVYMSKYKQLDI